MSNLQGAPTSDWIALHQLVMTYCRAMDRRDPDLLRSIYHDDASEDRGRLFKGSVDEWIAAMRKGFAENQWAMTTHRMFNTLFVIDGDTAQGEHYVEAYHRTHPPEEHELIFGGRYLDRYARRDGRWGIVYRTSCTDRWLKRPVDPTALDGLGSEMPFGRADASDLSYTMLDKFPRSGG